MKKMLFHAALMLAAPLALAQAPAFPSKPIRIIVPFNAGSGSDTGARVYACTRVRQDTVEGTRHRGRGRESAGRQRAFDDPGREMREFQLAEIERFRRVAKAAGIEPK